MDVAPELHSQGLTDLAGGWLKGAFSSWAIVIHYRRGVSGRSDEGAEAANVGRPVWWGTGGE